MAITNFIAAAEKVGAFPLLDRTYGHLLSGEAVRSDTWTGFLRASLDAAIAANGEAIAGEVGDVHALQTRALALLADVPDRPARGLVRRVYFPGRVWR